LNLLFIICAWYTLIMQCLLFITRVFDDNPPKKRFAEIILQLPTLIFIIMYFIKY